MKNILIRLLKVVLFLPMCFISGCYLPIVLIRWIITGNFAKPTLQYLIEWN